MKIIPWILSLFALVSCATTQQNYPDTPLITAGKYKAEHDTHGVVLMAINWGRRWKCGGFDNAELRGIGFDEAQNTIKNDDVPPNIVINSPSRLSNPVFKNYAFLAKPGKYTLSYFTIKVAKSTFDVGYLTAKRSKLFKNNKPIGGSFSVKAGEVVYIGNFWLDCTYSPILWRYYTKGKDTFDKHLGEYAEQYPFINLKDVSYRLFETNKFGQSYSLH